MQFEQLVAGQKDSRAQFKGQLWMEVFLVAGMNSMPADVSKIADHAKEIGTVYYLATGRKRRGNSELRS